jgi:uncharacterized DUF497 family protein
MKLTYDPAKSAKNIEQRQLPFEMVREVDWERAWIKQDTRREYGESRFQAMGYIGERLFVIIFTMREGAMRVISLRKANLREGKCYEEKTGPRID